MKIAFVIPSLNCGGSERVLSMMANYWIGQDRQVTIITMDKTGNDFFPLHPGIRRIGLGLVRPSIGMADALWSNLRRFVRVRKSIKSINPDIVISFLDRTNVLTLASMIGTGIPVGVSERTDPRERRIGKTWTWARRAMYRRAAFVAVQTHSVKEWALALGLEAGRVKVIPNPVALPARINRDTEGQRLGIRYRAGTMGRLIPSKGFEYLLRAFKECSDAMPDWDLLIIGDGECRAELETLRDRLGLGERVRFAGALKNPFQELAGLDLFIFTSLYEGFPNALVEAMSYAIPVISFDCPSGPAEIISEGVSGFLIPLKDEKKLSNAISLLMRDSDLRRKIGLGAMAAASRFSLPSVMFEWDDAIGTFLKNIPKEQPETPVPQADRWNFKKAER